MPENAASQAALLALRHDRRVIEEGHRFLDEKRVALAQELLRRAGEWAAARERFRTAAAAARASLGAAVGRHGLEGLQVYPPQRLEAATLASRDGAFLGVRLVAQAGLELTPAAAAGAEGRSFEGEHCAAAFRELLVAAVPLAAGAANLLRLMAEYRRTERRVRALENVVLPEARADERRFESALEELGQEEIMRSRRFAAPPG